MDQSQLWNDPTGALVLSAATDPITRGALGIYAIYGSFKSDNGNPRQVKMKFLGINRRSSIQIRGFHGTDPATIDREIAEIVRKVQRFTTAGVRHRKISTGEGQSDARS